MQNVQLWRSKRIRRRATLFAGLAVAAGLAVGGMAFGAAAKPKMQVLPSPYGLKYSQTVRVKAQNLPKGSGTIVLTICGLNNAKGAKIASPTADDCAGADDLNSGLVKLQKWKDGTFDQQYTLPKSGQKFAKNKRFCDAKHYCALVVADANPDHPAYHVDTKIQFTDQKSFSTTTKPKPATTKPKPKPTTTTTTQPDFSFKLSAGGSATVGPARGSATARVSVSVNAPDDLGTASYPSDGHGSRARWGGGDRGVRAGCRRDRAGRRRRFRADRGVLDTGQRRRRRAAVAVACTRRASPVSQ